MIRYVLRRFLQMLVVLWIVSLMTFMIFHAGRARPAREICNYHCTAAKMAEIEHNLGFDRPVLAQYLTYMNGLVTPDGRELGVDEATKVHCPWPCFDRSIHDATLVWPTMAKAFWPTFWLVLGGAVFWLAGGVLLGIAAARRRGQRADKISVGVAMVGASFPAPVVGYLLLFVFVVKFKVLPFPDTQNSYLFEVGPGPWLKFYLLPWITVALVNAALYTRLTRALMIDTMSANFIQTARAKGLSERRVTYKHGLRAVLAPIVTVFGLDVGTLLGGAVLTEQIFGIYGLGRVAVDAAMGIDLSVSMGVTMFGAFLVLIASLLVDLLYAVVDPRVKLAS